MKKALFLALTVLSAGHAPCEVSVTASRTYVDRKTKITSVTNDGDEVGFFIGTNTNKVFASTNALFKVTPEVYRITDGTNIIDSARNVFTNTVEYSSWTFSQPDLIHGDPYYDGGGIWNCQFNIQGYDLYLTAYGLEDSTSLLFLDEESGIDCIAERTAVIVHVPYGRLALTNDLVRYRQKSDLVVYYPETTPWACTELVASNEYSSMTNRSLWSFTTYLGDGYVWPELYYDGIYIGTPNSPIPESEEPSTVDWNMFLDSDLIVVFKRHVEGLDTGNRLATTNDVPRLTNTYDFATNVGLYTAVRDLILALGGSVTNFPSIGGN